jgi:hypothetical protein
MTRRELTIMAIAFALGVVVAVVPTIGIVRGFGADNSAVGAGRSTGANPSESPSVSAMPSPTVGVDANGTASPSPTSGAAARTDTKGSGTSGAVTSAPATCPKATTSVSTGHDLVTALSDAQPGDVIVMADGTYSGNFSTAVSGTSDKPIYLCGGPGAVLDGGGMSAGYVFHLDGAQYWRLIGFTVQDGQKGVVADGTVGSVIQGLTIHSVGDEALHLRRYSTDNTVTGNTVYDTGHHSQKFGEGIYIGTARSNWCNITDCQPDRSDRNLVEGNYVHDTTAENVDIKEGTTAGILRGNSFDGTGMVKAGADSWVDVKGNNWIIEGNQGVNSPNDGFQVHQILSGWGKGNRFRGNTATVNGPGVGFSLTPVQDNVVECSNVVSAAKGGYANISCQ